MSAMPSHRGEPVDRVAAHEAVLDLFFPSDAERAAHEERVRRLVEGRAKRMQSDGRPRFDLTDEERRRSTATAMRLADS